MKPSRIFLDLDDVLNCFTMSALRHVGCPVGIFDYSRFDPAWGWDIVAAANKLHPSRVFTEAGFWGAIRREFWASVPPSRELSLVFQCADYVGAENVCILSSPTLDPDCLAGKLEWIQRFLPKRYQRQYLIGPRKHFCARPDALLIDDRDQNVKDFIACGGQAILMPRPWNSLNAVSNPGVYVAKVLGRLFRNEKRIIA